MAKKNGAVRDCGAVMGAKFINIEINHALIEIGTGMAVKCGFIG